MTHYLAGVLTPPALLLFVLFAGAALGCYRPRLRITRGVRCDLCGAEPVCDQCHRCLECGAPAADGTVYDSEGDDAVG